MTYYVPGSQEKDPAKVIMSLQQAHEKTAANEASIAANTAAIADAVVGPASSTDNGFVVYDGTTGKLVKNHAATIALGSEVSGNLPVGNLGGGTSADATTFWRGDGTWDVPVLSKLTNSLTGDVSLSNTGSYFAGPTVAQGTTGTWLATGTVTVVDVAGAAQFRAKLWDGTTIIDSAVQTSAAAGYIMSISLSGYITSPAGNIRIDVKDFSSASGAIKFNASGDSKDSTLSVVRIA